MLRNQLSDQISAHSSFGFVLCLSVEVLANLCTQLSQRAGFITQTLRPLIIKLGQFLYAHGANLDGVLDVLSRQPFRAEIRWIADRESLLFICLCLQ